MPVDATHPRYDAATPAWRRMRVACAGEEAVKAAGPEFLPQLDGQEPDEYRSYLKRATFYGATGRTRTALVGAIWRKQPRIEFPQPELLKKIGKGGRSFEDIAKEATTEDVEVGRLGILVDAPTAPNATPFVTIYYAEDIKNWREAEHPLTGEQVKVEVVLCEEVEDRDPLDSFKTITRERRRVLRLGAPTVPYDLAGRTASLADYLAQLGVSEEESGEPFYFQELWIKREGSSTEKATWVLDEVIIPRMLGGRLLREIPFDFVNATDLRATPQEGALDALSASNLSLWRNSADLEHGAHYTSLPTAIVSGVDMEDGDDPAANDLAPVNKTTVNLPRPSSGLRIGSVRAWILPPPGAKAYYLEFTGAGLGAIRELMAEKKKEMASLGARLLEEPTTKGVEATATVELRQRGERSVLGSISGTLSQALTRALVRVASWLNLSGKASCALNDDFDTVGLDPALLTSFVGSLQAGALSFQSFFFNLEKRGAYPPAWTMEKEAAAISAGPPEGLAIVGATATQDSSELSRERFEHDKEQAELARADSAQETETE